MRTEMKTTPLEISRTLDISVAESWQAWTDPSLVGLWFAPGKMRCEVLDYNVCAGGSYSIVQGADHLASIKVANRAVVRTALETFERAAENSSTAVLQPKAPTDDPHDDSQVSALG